MILTKENVGSLHNQFLSHAGKALAKSKFDEALRYLSAASNAAYTFYIGFRDDRIEQMLECISRQIKQPSSDWQVSPDRVVFFDSFSQDSQGLSMQYVDAIIAAGYQMLYMTEFGLEDSRSKLLKTTLENYSKATIITIPKSLSGLKRAQFIFDSIKDFGASRLFMHIYPSSVAPVTAFYALPKQVTRYQVNLTDHTYWVGAGSMDYIFDFRSYGASLSAQHRGFRKNQIFMLPYYPMMKQTPFNGFPDEAKGKIKIFAGASYYKIIDENETFFKLNKAILDANPNAVTLFAGGGDRAMLDGLINKYGLQGRFIPIGQRNDIFQCYKHADIYLSTYPLFGGLMGQFAAHACLPILALDKRTGGSVEEVVCQKHNLQITLPTIDEVVKYATRLVNDPDYRKAQGELMHSCVITSDEFNESFKRSVETNTSPYPIQFEENVKLHYLNIDDKLLLENKTGQFKSSVWKTFGFTKSLFYNPTLILDAFRHRVKVSRFGKYF